MFSIIRCLSAHISYKGTHYFGFQKTVMGPSIQETLEQSLSTILRQPITVEGISRTDRGVHAKDQIIYFYCTGDIDLFKLKHRLNQLTPDDIAINEMEFVDETFAQNLQKRKKEYRYSVCNQSIQNPFHRDTSWHFFKPLDRNLMNKAIPHLLGKRDFSALTNAKYEDPVRTLESIEIVKLDGDRLEIRMVGDRFLYKMARNIVGTLVYVGCGKIGLNEVKKILENKRRADAGMTAPAHGLCLYKILT